MAASYRQQLNDVQPYEESQGTSSQPSPQELEAFYQDAQRKELERKLSKRSTGSRWTRRKSVRKNSAVNALDNEPDGKPPTVRSNTSGSQPPPTIRSTSTSASKGEQPMDAIQKYDVSDENYDAVPPMASRSLVPDALPQSPAIPGNMEEWPVASFRIKYPIHNPNGPRWYKNIHLLRPSVRPSSYFSPAFPPMSYAHEASIDPTRIAGPSRAPSASPAATPNSSQSRIVDPRSRKDSQTDNVDMLDVSDPWGQNWHHRSPYDLGYSTNSNPSTPDSEQPPPGPVSRPRRQSTISPPKPRLAPSPLSQSTSAIHLQTPPSDMAKGRSSFRVMRKLSKQRRPVQDGTFSPPPSSSGHQKNPSTSSAISPSVTSGPMQSASSLNLPGGKNREKRGSFLGRMVRRFSVLKRSSVQAPVQQDTVDRVYSPDVVVDEPASMVDPAPEPSFEPMAPPPQLQELHFTPAQDPETILPPVEHDRQSVEHDRQSSLSVEVPYAAAATGKLTIANPDADSVQSTPAAQVLLLPTEPNAAWPQGLDAPRAMSRESTIYPEAPYSMYLVSESSSTIMAHHAKVRPEPEPVTRPPLPEKSPRRGSAFVHRTMAPPPTTEASNRHSISSSLVVSPSSNAANIMESPLSVSSLFVNPPTPNPPPGAAIIAMPTPGPPVPPKLPEVQPSKLGNGDSKSGNGEARREPSGSNVSVKATSTRTVGSESRHRVPVPAVNGNGNGKKSSRDALGQSAPSKEGIRSRSKEGIRSHSKEESHPHSKEESRPHSKEGSHPHSKEGSRPHSKEGSSRSPDVLSQRTEVPEKVHRRRERTERSEATTTERQSGSDGKRDSRSVTGPREISRKQPTRVSSSPPRESRSSRRKEEARDQQSHPPSVAKKLPASAPNGATQVTVQRRPSKTARPVSEMPNSADLNSTKAKEAYEIERIWKSRSLHQLEPHAVVFPAFPSGTTTIAYQPTLNVGAGVNPGSSHTAFTVQSPFQHGSHPHHPMANGSPPTAAYSPSPSSPYSPSGASMNVQSPQSARSSNLPSPLQDATALLSAIPTRTNPLPEPPKESPYRPKTRTSHDTNNGLDLWTKYTGLTTAH